MRILSALVLLACLLSTTVVLAEDVYVTTNGTKYHMEFCRWIKDKNAKPIKKEDAVKEGLTPCKSCFKEESSKKSE